MLNENQQIFEQIEKAKKILIVFKQNASGDAISAALSLRLFLKKIDKQAEIASQGFQPPQSFSFLPGIKEIKNSINIEKKFIISLNTEKTPAREISYQVKDGSLEFIITPKDGQFSPNDITSKENKGDYDLIITTAAPDLESLGEIYEKNTKLFFNTPIINIDRHPHNEEYGQINKIKITAVSTTEIIFEMLKNYKPDLIEEDIANCLLTGIIAESKSFKIGSLTPNSLMIASELVKLGANRETIVRHLYQSRDLNTLKLWGRVLAKLKSDLEGKLIWSSLNKVDFEKTNSNDDGLEDVIEELIINIPEAEIIALFINGQNEKTKVKLFSTRNINALALMKDFNPSGSKNHAFFELNIPLSETEEKIIEHLKNKLEKLPL